MRVLRDVDEQEMIDAFVLAELESSRHRRYYAGLVGGDFSLYAKWKLVVVPIGELGDWRYAHEQTWRTLSKEARRIRVGARRVGKEPSIQMTSDCILAVENDLKNGRRASSYQPIIAAAKNEQSLHVIAEGHTRATAFVRALDAQGEIEVIVGYSPNLASWGYYHLP